MTTLIKPIITEKSMRAASLGLFTFEVLPSATKSQIKQAVSKAFKVNVTRVNVSLRHQPGKTTGIKRLKSNDGFSKYATVKLAKGQSIELFELKEN